MRVFGALIVNLIFFTDITHSKDPQEPLDDLVYDALRNFYNVLDVKNYDIEKLKEIVTDDFLVFEAAEKMDLNAFHIFLTHKDPNAEPLTHTNWQLSETRVSLDEGSAHVSYVNRGTFVHGTSLRVTIEWLESAFLIRKDNNFKIKFINANLISKDIQRTAGEESN